MENINTPQTQGNLALNQSANQVIATITSTINLPLLTDPQEVMLAAKENTVDGERFPMDKIKMPSGGGITFQFQDENGNATAPMEIRGIIIGFKPFKSWYEKAFDERSEDDDPYPDCFSSNCLTGSGCVRAGIPEGQACESCPKGQWGSSRRGSRGKDCSDRMRIWILLEGYAVPMYMDLPKTSLSNFKAYRKRLTSKAKVYYGVVTAISLEKDKSDTGKIEYSKAAFAKVADLAPRERSLIKQYIDTIANSLRIERDTISDDPAAHEDVDSGPDIDAVVNNMTGGSAAAGEANSTEPY